MEVKTDWDIRPFTDADYPALTAVLRTVTPPSDHPPSAEWIREDDRTLNPKVFRKRWTALSEANGGEAVGFAILTQDAVFWDPTQFVLAIHVSPKFQRQGLGSAFYSLLSQK